MFYTNLEEIINKLNSFPKEIRENTYLCLDIDGFTLKSTNGEETKTLNTKYEMLLKSLNKNIYMEEYLSVPDIAKHLSMSNNTVYSIIKEQDCKNPILPFIETPKGIRIKSSDYFMFLKKCYYSSDEVVLGNIENPPV